MNSRHRHPQAISPADQATHATAMPLDTAWASLEAHMATLLRAHTPAALLTVMAAGEDAPCRPGMRALVSPDGLHGSLGDADLDSHALAQARLCLANGVSGRFAWTPAPGAGSAHEQAAGLPAPLTAEQDEDALSTACWAQLVCEVPDPRDAAMYALAAEALAQGIAGIWSLEAPATGAPRRSLHVRQLPAALPEGMDADTARRALADWRQIQAALTARDETPQDATRRLDALQTQPVLLVLGSNPLARELAALAHACGFPLDVADARPLERWQRYFPTARRCLALPDFANLVSACGIGRQHYVCICIADADLARSALGQTLASHAAYIGMHASRSRRDAMYASLRRQGVPEAELAAVRCPLGLPVGAQSLRQLAVATVAELLAARAGTLQRLRNDDSLS